MKRLTYQAHWISGEDGLGGAGLGGAGFEFGVDPNEDPELALVSWSMTNSLSPSSQPLTHSPHLLGPSRLDGGTTSTPRRRTASRNCRVSSRYWSSWRNPNSCYCCRSNIRWSNAWTCTRSLNRDSGKTTSSSFRFCSKFFSASFLFQFKILSSMSSFHSELLLTLRLSSYSEWRIDARLL